MEIPRALLDDYTSQLNTLSKAAQKLVLNALRNAEWNTIAELREIMIAVMDQVCSVVSDDAAVVASGLYDDIREVSVGRKLGEIASSSYNESKMHSDVRAMIQSVIDTGSAVMLGRDLTWRVDYEIKVSANMATEKLSKLDPLKPKWARVPTGDETCGWCIILASRGYDYHSKETASHAHPNCDCRVVPQFGNEAIEGYDVSRYEQLYSDNVIRDKYGKVDINATSYAIEKQLKLEQAIKENIDYSEVPRSFFGVQKKITDYSPGNFIKKGNEWRDLFAYDALAVSGRKLKPRNSNAPKGYANIDAYIDNVLYEFKSPEPQGLKPKKGNELKFIDDNLHKAAKQFANQYDNITGEKLIYDGDVNVVLNLKYRPIPTKQAKEEIKRVMKKRGVDNVILVTAKGRIIEV